MTLVNIHIKEEEKKKLQKYVESHTDNSMSEFVRNIIGEKIKQDELIDSLQTSEKNEIPEYIPKEKYVVFVKGSIIAVGDNPSDLADIAMQRFPDLPAVIIFNGKKKKPMHYAYMNLTEWNAWKYVKNAEQSYPTLPIRLMLGNESIIFSASIDTAASLCILREDFVSKYNLLPIRTEQISTASGIIQKDIYLIKVSIEEAEFEVECISAPIPESFPFKFLMGRNLFDLMDAYFLGKKQVLMLKLAD